MKQYSLVRIKNKETEKEAISWATFEEKMKKHQVEEAIIFAVGKELTTVNLAKRSIISEVIVKPDQVGCWDEYCIVDHENGGKVIPCLVLLDPEIEYAVIKAIEFQPNDFLIQCRFILPDNRFIVNRCELDLPGSGNNLSIN